jgi:hypothetical protein
VNPFTINLDPQQLFDTIVKALKAQGWKRSLAKNGLGCAYRGEHGRKCAIGHIIPDEIAKDNENMTVGSMILDKKIVFTNAQSRGLAKELQHDHDQGMTPEKMRERLKKTAAYFELSDAEVAE